jgi:uncharacterized repeat protein (TIGR01451 family)
MKRTIKNTIEIGFLLVLLALPFVLSGCGTKKANLGITNTVDKTAVSVGDQVTYTITLTNNGSVNATGITVTDALPVGVTYVSSSASQGSYDNSTGIWTVGNLDNKASAKLTITADVAKEAGVQTIDNVASVTHSDQPDVNSDNEIAASSFTVQSTDLGVTIAVDNAKPSETDTVTYTIILDNNGPSNATGVSVYDALPQGVTYVSSNADQGSYDASTGNWTVGNVDNGASTKLTITATVDSGTGALSIDNNAQIIYADQPDSNLSNNVATASITVNGADLEITNSLDNITPNENDTVTYTTTLDNNGPLDATGVIITDVLPAGVTYVSSTADEGSYDASTGIWTVGNIANGANANLTIKMTVNSGTSKQTITFTAGVKHSDQADGITGNNTSTTTITVN